VVLWARTRRTRRWRRRDTREEIERTFDLISSQPKVGARAVNASLQGVGGFTWRGSATTSTIGPRLWLSRCSRSGIQAGAPGPDCSCGARTRAGRAGCAVHGQILHRFRRERKTGYDRWRVIAQAWSRRLSTSILGSVIDSIAQRTPSRPRPEPFTPPNGKVSTRNTPVSPTITAPAWRVIPDADTVVPQLTVRPTCEFQIVQALDGAAIETELADLQCFNAIPRPASRRSDGHKSRPLDPADLRVRQPLRRRGLFSDR
jgi:hypothetical protein